MEEFSLEGRPHIELNKLLKFIGWTESGGEANAMISEGCVEVNGKVDTRKRAKLKPGDEISFQNQSIKVAE